MSKIFRRPSCQKASDGTDGATGRPSAKCAGLATLGSSTQAFLKHVSFSVRWKRRFPAPAIYLPDAARSFGQDLARQRQPQSGVVLTEASTASRSNVVGFCPGRVIVLSVAC
jgi:hypothetical protein